MWPQQGRRGVVTEAEVPPLLASASPPKDRVHWQAPCQQALGQVPPDSPCPCSEHLNSRAKHDVPEPGPESPYHTARADAKGAVLEHSLGPRVQTSSTACAGMLAPQAQETIRAAWKGRAQRGPELVQVIEPSSTHLATPYLPPSCCASLTSPTRRS